MASKAERGTKRTCQGSSCGARFYDLNRDPIVCPICGTAYHIASGPASPSDSAASRRAAKKPEFVPAIAPGEAPEVEVEDALVDVEGGEEPVAAGEDETFLETEEDEGGDVSGIIVGGTPEGEEEV